MKYTKIATQSIDTSEPIIIILRKYGHDYTVATVNTEDGHIETYYNGQSVKTAWLWYNGVIARIEIADDYDSAISDLLGVKEI